MSAPVKLAENVYRIGTLGPWINAYIFVEPNGELTLVDAGLKGAPKKIVRAIESLGKKPSDVKAPPRDRRRLSARVLGMMSSKFEPCEIDEDIADGQLLDIAGGLRVVHTPGHTLGHVSLLHEPSGVLIVGDSLFNTRGIGFSLAPFCSDIPLSRETAGRLGELEFEVAAFMHGPEIRERARERVREFIARRLGR
ncbi:MAG: MBL fold metallo-hydrolase [Actinobacteria bacterium]|nr:MAG: MBL fold metallo-hydrolase [Actinomycetota bacterium]